MNIKKKGEQGDLATMVCELQFSRPIALLHGALLRTGKICAPIKNPFLLSFGPDCTNSKGKTGDGDEARHLRLEEALKEVIIGLHIARVEIFSKGKKETY